LRVGTIKAEGESTDFADLKDTYGSLPQSGGGGSISTTSLQSTSVMFVTLISTGAGTPNVFFHSRGFMLTLWRTCTLIGSWATGQNKNKLALNN